MAGVSVELPTALRASPKPDYRTVLGLVVRPLLLGEGGLVGLVVRPLVLGEAGLAAFTVKLRRAPSTVVRRERFAAAAAA